MHIHKLLTVTSMLGTTFSLKSLKLTKLYIQTDYIQIRWKLEFKIWLKDTWHVNQGLGIDLTVICSLDNCSTNFSISFLIFFFSSIYIMVGSQEYNNTWWRSMLTLQGFSVKGLHTTEVVLQMMGTIIFSLLINTFLIV